MPSKTGAKRRRFHYVARASISCSESSLGPNASFGAGEEGGLSPAQRELCENPIPLPLCVSWLFFSKVLLALLLSCCIWELCHFGGILVCVLLSHFCFLLLFMCKRMKQKQRAFQTGLREKLVSRCELSAVVKPGDCWVEYVRSVSRSFNVDLSTSILGARNVKVTKNILASFPEGRGPRKVRVTSPPPTVRPRQRRGHHHHLQPFYS